MALVPTFSADLELSLVEDETLMKPGRWMEGDAMLPLGPLPLLG